MACTKSLIFVFMFMVCVIFDAFATVDYLGVNEITKELYSFDQEQMPGIFWVVIGENAEDDYLALGYTYTENPYVLDNWLTLIIVGVTALVLFFLGKRKLIKRDILMVLFYLHLILALKYIALYSYRDAFGLSVSIIVLIIPSLLFVFIWMIEKIKVRRYASLLQVVFTVIFSYLLFLQIWMY